MVEQQGQESGSNGRAALGKGLERLEILSGEVVLIDQFMLGNQQFLSRLADTSAGTPELEKAVQMYGGCVMSVSPGSYHVFRDPYELIMVVYPQAPEGNQAAGDEADSEQLDFDLQSVLKRRDGLSPEKSIFVDTRCLVMIDSELLVDQSLIARYQELRKKARDKEARDLLRDQGAAVRYGFNRYGDELGVFRLDDGLLALSPDIAE